MKRILLLSFVLCIAAACAPSGGSDSAALFDDVLASRRSVRNYDPSKTVSEDDVRAIILAAQDAPSWANTQTTRYYVAMSKEKADAVRELVGPRNKENIEGAPVLIVSTYVTGQAGFSRSGLVNEIGDGWGAYDNGLSNAYLILKARAMGFDTLIMGYRDSDSLRALFNIPPEEAVMAVISLGHRASDPVRPPRKDLEVVARFF